MPWSSALKPSLGWVTDSHVKPMLRFATEMREPVFSPANLSQAHFLLLNRKYIMHFLNPNHEHPTKAAMQKVIDRFQTVLPYAKKNEKHFDMREPDVNCSRAISCGTPHCAGGWYFVANRRRKALKDLADKFGADFYAGSVLMARDLGFQDSRHLELWADKNSKIWGNNAGSEMFGTERAWGDAKSLAGLVRHLKRVQRRLPA